MEILGLLKLSMDGATRTCSLTIGDVVVNSMLYWSTVILVSLTSDNTQITPPHLNLIQTPLAGYIISKVAVAACLVA